jgi:ankyrin repeat protein
MFLAALNGSAAAIAKLLDAGVDVNAPIMNNGETALMMAARTGAPDALRLLLARGAAVNAREKLRGTTALMWAAYERHPEAVKLLLARGADPALRSNTATLGRSAYLAPTVVERARSAGTDLPPRGQRGRRGEQGVTISAEGVQRLLDQDDPDPLRGATRQGGGLTALVFAARVGDLESARALVEGGADVNQTTEFGWTALLTAVQNRRYVLATYLLEKGADPNLANKGGWTPLYLAVDNRNIESGDYPVRGPDRPHLDMIRALLDSGANVNARAKDSTETRTIFTMQWLNEDGATPFLRAAQSGDVTLMKLLLGRGADPKIATTNGTTALMVAAGIGWVEGVTYEWSPKDNLDAVRLLLDLGVDPNVADGDGRTALHGAGHKGRSAVVQVLVDRGAKLDARDHGSRDTINGALLGHGWQALDYAEGLVRVGVQSAIPHPDTAALIRKLMADRGLAVPPVNRTLESICVVEICQ